MDIKHACESQIEKMIQKVATQEHMMEYLDMLSRFPQMGMENILLLLAQMPDATVVCGKGAWQKYGAVVKEGKKPIALLGIVETIAEYEDDEIEDEEDEEEMVVDFDVVAVYDLSQVEITNKTPQFCTEYKMKIPIEQHLREKYGLSIVDDLSGENIGNKIRKSVYRDDEKTLYLKHGLTAEQIEAEMIKNYIKIALVDRNVPDFLAEMEHFATIAICKHFKLQCADNTIRPSELFTASQDEKRVFLHALADNVFSIICELSGKEILTFNETALCNILFSSPNKADVYASIGDIMEMSGNISVREFTKNAMSRILGFNEDIYTEIKKRRDMQILFTFPPAILNE